MGLSRSPSDRPCMPPRPPGPSRSMPSDPMVPLVHIVDDDAAFRRAMARLLQACGYRVALYESGNRLLESAPSAEPGCILLDVRMTGLGGWSCRIGCTSAGLFC